MMEGMESKSILGVRIDNFNNNFEKMKYKIAKYLKNLFLKNKKAYL